MPEPEGSCAPAEAPRAGPRQRAGALAWGCGWWQWLAPAVGDGLGRRARGQMVPRVHGDATCAPNRPLTEKEQLRAALKVANSKLVRPPLLHLSLAS